MDTAELLLTAVGLIAGSAFLSGSEVALFSLSRFELRAMKASFPEAHRRMKELLSDPGGLLLTILFTNEIVNIALSTLFTEAIIRRWASIDERWGDSARNTIGAETPAWVLQLLLTTAIATPVILLCCEVTPKVIGTRLNRIVAPRTAAVLYWVYRAFFPLRVASRFLISIFHRRKNPTSDGRVEPGEIAALAEDEFLFMVEEGHKEGKVKRTELELVRNLFELDDTRVGEIHTPLTDMITVTAGESPAQFLASLKGRVLPSRIPVMNRARTQVVGILHVKDLLRARIDPELAGQSIEELAKKPLYIRSGTQLNTLFRRLKENKTSIAIVTNEKEEPLGLVTMNDVLYELFEDLFPEDLSAEGGA